jgi:hypothetical protein
MTARTALNRANGCPFHKTQLAEFNKSTLQRSHASHSNGRLGALLLFSSMHDDSLVLSRKPVIAWYVLVIGFLFNG